MARSVSSSEAPRTIAQADTQVCRQTSRGPLHPSQGPQDQFLKEEYDNMGKKETDPKQRVGFLLQRTLFLQQAHVP